MDTSTPFHRRIVFFDGFSGSVQFRANVVSEVFQRAPTLTDRMKKVLWYSLSSFASLRATCPCSTEQRFPVLFRTHPRVASETSACLYRTCISKRPYCLEECRRIPTGRIQLLKGDVAAHSMGFIYCNKHGRSSLDKKEVTLIPFA